MGVDTLVPKCMEARIRCSQIGRYGTVRTTTIRFHCQRIVCDMMERVTERNVVSCQGIIGRCKRRTRSTSHLPMGIQAVHISKALLPMASLVRSSPWARFGLVEYRKT